MGSLLTLREFTSLAAAAVEAAGAAPANGQAKAVPAERMVRYYAARGLLPRPGTRGRALVYGRRHVLCLVAVKRLQGEGLSLEEIAGRLEGLSSTELEALAAIPAGTIPADLDDVTPTPGPARGSTRFWASAAGRPEPRSSPVAVEVPPEFPEVGAARGRTSGSAARAGSPASAAPLTPPAPSASAASPASDARPAPGGPPAPAGPPEEVQATSLVALRLSDTVTVLVADAGTPLPPLSRIQAAARPLLDLLSAGAAAPPDPTRSRPQSA